MAFPTSRYAEQRCTLPKTDPRALIFAAWLKARRMQVEPNRRLFAEQCGFEAGHLGRLENGQRMPGRGTLDALVRGLRLSAVETDRIYVLCGYAPPSLERIGWPSFFTSLCAALAAEGWVDG